MLLLVLKVKNGTTTTPLSVQACEQGACQTSTFQKQKQAKAVETLTDNRIQIFVKSNTFLMFTQSKKREQYRNVLTFQTFCELAEQFRQAVIHLKVKKMRMHFEIGRTGRMRSRGKKNNA